MSIGTAKIATVVGGGAYTIDQVFWDADHNPSADWVQGTTGLVGVEALSAIQRTDLAVGDIVVFVMQEMYQGLRQPIIIDAVENYLVKVDAADTPAYLESQLRGGTSSTTRTVREENIRVDKINVAGDDDIIAIRHTTPGDSCYSCDNIGTIFWDATGHITMVIP